MKVTYFGLSKLASAIDCCRLHFVALQKGLAFFFFFLAWAFNLGFAFFLKKLFLSFHLMQKDRWYPKRKSKGSRRKRELCM